MFYVFVICSMLSNLFSPLEHVFLLFKMKMFKIKSKSIYLFIFINILLVFAPCKDYNHSLKQSDRPLVRQREIINFPGQKRFPRNIPGQTTKFAFTPKL